MGEFGYRQGCVRVLEDNSATVQLAHGNKDSPKTGHYRRTVGFVEGKCLSGVMWLDDVPGTENWSDIFTKSVEPSEQFYKLRDVIMGVNPTLFVSRGVADMIRTGVSADANFSVRRAVAWLNESDEE